MVRVKANQPNLHEAIVSLSAEETPFVQRATVDRRHGPEEHRRAELFAVAGRLPPERQTVIACAARIPLLSWCKDTGAGLWQSRRETAYYVSKIELTTEHFGRGPRHSGIEDRAHHVRDRILGEDTSRIRCHPGIFARTRSLASKILRSYDVPNVSEAIHTNTLSLQCLATHGLPKAQS